MTGSWGRRWLDLDHDKLEDVLGDVFAVSCGAGPLGVALRLRSSVASAGDSTAPRAPVQFSEAVPDFPCAATRLLL